MKRCPTMPLPMTTTRFFPSGEWVMERAEDDDDDDFALEWSLKEEDRTEKESAF
jgi:hypothetical protein